VGEAGHHDENAADDNDVNVDEAAAAPVDPGNEHGYIKIRIDYINSVNNKN